MIDKNIVIFGRAAVACCSAIAVCRIHKLDILKNRQGRITPDIVERFGTLLRTSLRDGDPALRQGYVRLLVNEVQVNGKDILIRGSKKALEHAVLATAKSPKAIVPSFARKWCARQDSNLWPPD